ncbi:MAG: hypothetical protein JSV89_16970 [Spirochaetaceae bacterium]|nr:MAG: hypothetical protein JSV89_16970 [Spirochaetaceae bacterium]
MGRDRFSGAITQEADLHFLIQQLDGIRAFRRVDPARIEQSFNRLELYRIWGGIKKDVHRIVYFPETIQGLPRLIKITTTLRSLFPIAILSLLLSVLIRLGIFPMPITSVYLIFLFVPLAIMAAFISTDLTVRKRIAAVEKANPELHVAEKHKIREVIVDLLNRLNVEIRLKKVDPQRFRMRLYFDDYPGIVVLSEKVDRVFGVFRRSYSRYLSVPSGQRRK